MASRVQVSMLTKLEAEKTGVPAANRSAFAGCSERADTPLPKAVDRDQSKARTLLVPLSSRLGACRGRHAPGCRGRRGHCGRGSSAHLAVDLAVDAEGSGEHTREIVGPVRHDHLVGRRVSVSGPRSRVVVRVRERVRIGAWARVRARVPLLTMPLLPMPLLAMALFATASPGWNSWPSQRVHPRTSPPAAAPSPAEAGVAMRVRVRVRVRVGLRVRVSDTRVDWARYSRDVAG